MTEANPQHARELLARAVVEEITASEHDWLERHLATCTECAKEAEMFAGAVRSLRAFSPAASPDLIRRTRLAVSSRARELHTARASSVPLWIATGMSVVWMMLTTPYVWRGFAWIGQIGKIPEPVWQVCFLMWWFLPATVLAVVATWRHLRRDDMSNWFTESYWGHR